MQFRTFWCRWAPVYRTMWALAVLFQPCQPQPLWWTAIGTIDPIPLRQISNPPSPVIEKLNKLLFDIDMSKLIAWKSRKTFFYNVYSAQQNDRVCVFAMRKSLRNRTLQTWSHCEHCLHVHLTSGRNYSSHDAHRIEHTQSLKYKGSQTHTHRGSWNN